MCGVAKTAVRDTRCPWLTPVQGVGRVGLWCPQVDESLLGLLREISDMDPYICTGVGSTYRTDAESPRRDLFHSA